MTKTLSWHIKFGVNRSVLHAFVHTLKICLVKKGRWYSTKRWDFNKIRKRDQSLKIAKLDIELWTDKTTQDNLIERWDIC